MSPATDRSDAAIHREIVRLLAEFNNVSDFLEACEDTAVMADTMAARRRGRAEQEAEHVQQFRLAGNDSLHACESLGTAAEGFA